MAEYEVLIESITPCGGEKYAKKEFFDIETDDPVSYVRETGHYPILETKTLSGGDLQIVTGNGKGYLIRYTFSA